MNSKKWLLILLAALLAAFAILHVWPDDQRAIRRQLALIEKDGSMPAAEQPVEALVKAGRIAERFRDPCRLQVDEAGFDRELTRRELIEHLAAFRARHSRIEVRFLDLGITVRNPTSASLRATLRVQGQVEGEAIDDGREVEAELAKTEGVWLITALRLVQVLDR